MTQPAATTDEARTGSSLPWILGGLAVLAVLAALLLFRRRRDDEPMRDEATYVDAPVITEPSRDMPVERPLDAATPAHWPSDPEPAIEPAIAAAPAAMPRHEPEVVHAATEAVAEAELAEPAREDLADVTDVPAPVANRPWLEFGLRPVRAGTSEEEALVDVELTVGNAGDTPARDVRISTFMLADAESSEVEQMLMEHDGETTVPPVTIEPGDGTRVDAHLAVPKGELGRTFNPVVVAEARYTLPDGREGRTSAAFRIGRPAYEGGIGAIGASRPHMVDELASELVGTPDHA